MLLFNYRLKHLYKTANLTYALPLHRATPYVFGVGLGALLHSTGKNVRIHKVFLNILSRIVVYRGNVDVLISGVSDLGMVDRDGLGILVVIFTMAPSQKGLRVRC